MREKLNGLLKNGIVIPMIQRDYAQGRVSYEEERAQFLCKIENALKNGETFPLQFVYGSKNGDGKFIPLDGQQRLTTLWLIKWYLSFKNGKLEKDKILKNFEYETRHSTQLFIDCLLDEDKVKLEDIEDIKEHTSIAEYICMQTWFVQEWRMDPTIDSMLRMISGTNYLRGNDSIEGVFSGDSKTYYINFEKGLLDFEYYEINSNELPTTDELYIKLNARGKDLTNFERMKPDMLKTIGVTAEEEFTQKLDGSWLDLFWNYEKEVLGEQFYHSIDDEVFMFINRFAMNQLIEKNLTLSQSDLVNIPEYKILYGDEGNDQNIKYQDYECYKNILTDDKLTDLCMILDILSDKAYGENIIEIIESSNGHVLFPRYKKDRKLKGRYKEPIELAPTTNEERVFFYSICKYLIIRSKKKAISWTINDLDLKRWVRVTNNLIESAYITNDNEMLNCFKCFKDLLDEYENSDSLSIYSYLSAKKKQTEDEKIYSQLNEEITKADKIFNDSYMDGELFSAAKEFLRDENPSWEKLFEYAEKTAFFKGSIRFLFNDEKGNPSDWANFVNKLNNAGVFFGIESFEDKDDEETEESDGEEQNSYKPVDEALKKEEDRWYKTILSFLKCFKGFTDFENESYYVFTTLGNHSRGKSWKRHILCNLALCSQVSKFLSGTEESSRDGDYEEFISNESLIRAIVRLVLYKVGYYYIKKNENIASKPYSIAQFHHPNNIIYIHKSRLDGYEMLSNKNIMPIGNPNENFEYVDKLPMCNGYLYKNNALKFKYLDDTVIWNYDDKIYDQDQKLIKDSLEEYINSKP